MRPYTSFLILLGILYLCAGCSVSGTHANSTGYVLGVSDGDTVKVLREERIEKIRLRGIDCPEKNQPFGTQAKQMTEDLAYGKTVGVSIAAKDRYGRSIGDLTLPDGRVLSQLLVARGLCWWYRQYAGNDNELRLLETKAKSAGIGLWSGQTPVPPWIFRKQQNAKDGQGAQGAELPMIKLSQNGVCHLPGSRDYLKTRRFRAIKNLADCLTLGGRVPKVN